MIGQEAYTPEQVALLQRQVSAAESGVRLPLPMTMSFRARQAAPSATSAMTIVPIAAAAVVALAGGYLLLAGLRERR